jgi:hypothetical protein
MHIPTCPVALQQRMNMLEFLHLTKRQKSFSILFNQILNTSKKMFQVMIVIISVLCYTMSTSLLAEIMRIMLQ